MNDAEAGDLFVTGHRGIRVPAAERPRESQPFEFMASPVSSEKPKGRPSARWLAQLRQVKADGKITSPSSARPWCTPGGVGTWPASSRRATSTSCSPATPWPRTTSSRPCSARAWASTSRGRLSPAATSITCARSTASAGRGGIRPPSSRASSRRHHVRSASRPARPSSWPAASATTARCPRSSPTCWPPSGAMREQVRGVGFCLMIATTLHSIAVGNLLPAWVQVVCVDINPRDGHQARRPRQHPDRRPGHRRRASCEQPADELDDGGR